MVYVRVKDDEPFEKALRKFKNKWIKSGILREVKARSFYLKPSAARKLAKRSKKKRGCGITFRQVSPFCVGAISPFKLRD